MKDELGRIVLDNYLPLNHYTTGRKEKIWLMKDGQTFLFKTGATNYEILAELISEKLAKQCGFPTAEYRLAIYKGKLGVVTPSFLKKGEIIVTGDEYITHAKEIAKQNNINLEFKGNSVENLLNACALQDTNANLSQILFQLLTIYCFDLTIMESDRNLTNISIIKDLKGNIKIAPIYDCSTMAKMNTNIDSLVNNIRDDSHVYNITDNISYALKLTDDDSLGFMNEFSKLCEMFPKELSIIMAGIEKIDVEEAILAVENDIQTEQNNFAIPFNVKYWLKKAITYRKNDLLSVYRKSIAKLK